MTTLTIVAFIAGLVLLVFGADWLVRGASNLATAWGISPLVVGLTVVAYGTSAPELAVSINAVMAGQADLSLGNVVGSNICNVLLILGASAAITPLVVNAQLIRMDVPIMVGITLLTWVLVLDGRIGRLEGLLLVAGALAYTVLQIKQARTDPAADGPADEAPAQTSLAVNVFYIVVGFGGLVLGARWLVSSAVTFATALGVSELVIGLTIVAVGTSLPEVATSIVAAIRGERDIAVGNVVGSNIFNILTVLGVSASVSPVGLEVPAGALNFDIPVMVAVAIACLPVFARRAIIGRWEGVLFLFYYVAYTTYVVMAAQHHDMLPTYEAAMLTFILPLTALTLVVMSWQSVRTLRG